ncbi:Immunoglobulin omega chain [Galemys pyrenaicus]|nr:Immunoglobulin omega chain [Galemys pyrenaicus]
MLAQPQQCPWSSSSEGGRISTSASCPGLLFFWGSSCAAQVRMLQSWQFPALSLALPYPVCTPASVSPGSGPQPALNQPPSVSSSLGTTIHLPCTLSSDYDISVYNIYWYQQKPGQPPRLLLSYVSHSKNMQAAEIPPRFSGYKDVTTNTGYLSISDLRPEDEGMYYCALGSQRMERERREEKESPASGPPTPLN